MLLSNFAVIMGAVVSIAIAWILAKVIPWILRFRAVSKALGDVGCEKYHWFLGHTKQVSPTQESLLDRARNRTKKFPKCVKVWYGPIFPRLNCYHPDMVKSVLETDQAKDFSYEFIRPWIGDGLLLSYGSKWKRNRRLLTPLFHFDVLKVYVRCANEAATEMLDKWSPGNDDSVRVEMFHEVSSMALDNIIHCLLSKKSRCQYGENWSYLEAVKNMTRLAMTRIFNPLYQIDVIFYMTKSGKAFKDALKTAHDFSEKVIRERKAILAAKKKDTSTTDFLDTLLLAKDERGVGLPVEEIRDEVNTFIFEGHDTVTSALSFAFYNLAKYPKFQEKCRKEALEVLSERKVVKWEDLPKFSYLTMFIKESLRLYPPVPAITRKIVQPFFVPRGFAGDQYNIGTKPSPGASRTLPKGMYLCTHIFFLHRNPHLWEDPEVFDPDRFTMENIAKRSPHAYIPFSSGPRNCIGQNFAMNEIKIVLALALTRYRFSVDTAHPEPEIESSVVLRSKTGIHIKIEKLV